MFDLKLKNKDKNKQLIFDLLHKISAISSNNIDPEYLLAYLSLTFGENYFEALGLLEEAKIALAQIWNEYIQEESDDDSEEYPDSEDDLNNPKKNKDKNNMTQESDLSYIG